MATSERAARKDRMRAATARRADPDAKAAGVTAERSRPVRITIDLSPADYDRLTAWTVAAAKQPLMPVKVTTADAIRAMIRTVDEDLETTLAVLNMIRMAKESQ